MWDLIPASEYRRINMDRVYRMCESRRVYLLNFWMTFLLLFSGWWFWTTSRFVTALLIVHSQLQPDKTKTILVRYERLQYKLKGPRLSHDIEYCCCNAVCHGDGAMSRFRACFLGTTIYTSDVCLAHIPVHLWWWCATNHDRSSALPSPTNRRIAICHFVYTYVYSARDCPQRDHQGPGSVTAASGRREVSFVGNRVTNI